MRIGVCLVLMMVGMHAHAQVASWGPLFPQTEVTKMYVTIDADSLNAVFAPANLGNSHEFPCNISYVSTADSVVLNTVGFRCRGNTSLYSQKKSYKIKIDSFSNLNLFGAKELNLIGSHNDPSLIRAKLCWDLFRSMGIPSSRSSFVALYINDVYAGLYLNVEQYDDVFAANVLDDGTGNLWKCFYGSDLHYINATPSSYDLPNYDLVENKARRDYNQLAEFIQVLNQTPLAQLPCALERIFNVHDFLKIAAADVLLGNWDNYIFNSNNFYLYHNEHTGLIEYIPFDLDNTLGVDWFGVDWASRNPYTWQPSNATRPLFTRLLQIPSYRNEFSNYLQAICDSYFNENVMTPHAYELLDLITPYALDDPFRPLDYGFTTDDFLQSVDQAWGQHITYGIADYITVRKTQTLQMLDDLLPYTSIHNVVGNLQNDSLFIEVVTNLSSSEFSFVWKEVGSTEWQVLPATQVGSYTVNENRYVAQVAILNDSIDVLVGALPNSVLNDIDNNDCDFRYVYGKRSSTTLVINELAPQGSFNALDNYGEADDWIEIHNYGSSSVNLANKYLSDDPTNWNKWRLPNANIPAGGFMLFYADNQYEQGTTHLGFKLSNTAETIVLSEEVNHAHVVIDSTSYSNIAVNETWGRATDANLPWIVFTNTTPNYSNTGVGIDEKHQSFVRAYPIPTAHTLFLSEPCSGTVYNNIGEIVFTFYNESELDCSRLTMGLYVLRTDKSLIRFVVERH